MHQEMVYVVAGVLAGGVAAHWLGWRLRVPPIVFLLLGGLVVGPVTGAVDPDETFGDVLLPAVSLAVAVILFEGALALGARGVRSAGTTVWMLITVGAAVTMVATTLLGRWVLGVGWDLAALIAAVLVVTGPTVIGPIVNAIGLKGRVGAILEAEGTLIDPIGAILAVLVFEVGFGHDAGGLSVATGLVATIAVGAIVGGAAGALLLVGLHRYLVPDQLLNVTVLATVIGSFALANLVREEAGLVAVTAMGLLLASQRLIAIDEISDFNETLRILFISGLFILLGARIDSETLRSVEVRNLVFLGLLIVVVRPLAVAASTLRTPTTRRERAFIAATAPRGIVAAAVASIFSIRLAALGEPGGQALVSVTFTVIAGTVLLSGFGSRPLARRLGLVEDGPELIVVLGANEVARATATALERSGAPVRLVDLDREQLASARMSGLDAHQGSVLSDETWDRAGLERAACFLAMTANDELNIVAARHAVAVLGRGRVFQLPPGRREHRAWWELPPGTLARPLFALDASYRNLAERLEGGATVTTTKLTDQFTPDDYAAVHPDALIMFVVDGRGRISLAAAGSPPSPRRGDTVGALVAGDG